MSRPSSTAHSSAEHEPNRRRLSIRRSKRTECEFARRHEQAREPVVSSEAMRIALGISMLHR